MLTDRTGTSLQIIAQINTIKFDIFLDILNIFIIKIAP